jgi:hypothetical protein
MFDIFYSGRKPGLFAHERAADSIEHAQSLSRTRFFWWINYLADYSGWDFLWEPVPWQKEYTHVWPSQHHEYSGTYLVPRSGEIKYHFHKNVIPNKYNPDNFDTLTNNVEFDYSWAPHPMDPPFIYVFGNQWWSAEKMPTVEYHVPGASERKYMDKPRAKLTKNLSRPWYNVVESDMDYSWVPDPGDPPYIYVFGNQWWSAEKMPTVEYRVPGATEQKYVRWPTAKLFSDTTRWSVPDNIDPATVNYSWVPDPGDTAYIYQFGTQHQRTGGPVYTVPGATEIKYVSYPRTTKVSTDNNWTIPIGADTSSFDWTWHPDATEPPYIYQFGTQHQRTGGPVYTVPGATEIKYISYPHTTKVSTDNNWTIPIGADTSSFDWTWHPDATEPPYIYQFGTQHQRTGGPVYTVPGATEIKYVEQIKIKVDSTSAVIVEIDHLDGNAGQIPDTVKCVRYFNNYRDTLVRLANNLLGKYEFVWVCSSICDYSEFDFSWHPEQWQATMLHVFASDEQKFGDTFYMHVPTFAEYGSRKALLEWYDVNFVNTSVSRRPMPIVEHTFDSQAEAVRTQDWAGPLALFTNTDCVSGNLVTVPLWRENVKTIVPLSEGATSVIVPKTAVPYIKTQLYDYPYIDRTHRKDNDQPLDIVFISNGEKDAEANFNWLTTVVRPAINRTHWSDGVSGRVAAYHAAAELSTTPWFFAVFAKLRVDQHFDWSWQPDRMQQAKHYIFHARNTINDLEYGHQGMIAYNKKLVLENAGHGLDFTLDQPHEVVPVLSGEAIYYTSNWVAWRTAFRECLKLRASLPDVENEYRLKQWLDVDHGAGQWSSKGAQDAVEYYEEVDGDFEQLRKSYEWAWLATYAFVKRSLTTDP